MTATASAPAEAACSASPMVSVVVWAPQWTATSSRPAHAAEEEIRHPPPLGQREEDAFTGRPHGQDPVEAPRGQEPGERLERVLVQCRPTVAEWRHGGCESALDHEANLMLRGDELASEHSNVIVTSQDPGHHRQARAAQRLRRGSDRRADEAFADVGERGRSSWRETGRASVPGPTSSGSAAAIDLSYDQNVADAMRLYRMLEASTLPGAGRGPHSGLRTRGRLGRRRLCRRRRGRRGCGLRVHGGAARHHPGRDLAVRVERIGPGAARRYFLTGERFGPRPCLASVWRTRSPRPRRGGRPTRSTASSRPAPRRSAPRSASSASARPGRLPPTSPPRYGRAPRAKRACERFSKKRPATLPSGGAWGVIPGTARTRAGPDLCPLPDATSSGPFAPGQEHHEDDQRGDGEQAH